MKNNSIKCVLVLANIGYVITMCLFLFAFFISQDLFGIRNFTISNWLIENSYSSSFFGYIGLTISSMLLLVASILKLLEKKQNHENCKD